jgi:hypothetical protein
MGLSDAYATSAKIFAQVSKRNDPGLAAMLETVKPGDIAVVRGVHDRVQEVLDALKMPYEMFENISAPKLYDNAKVVFVNCQGYGIEAESDNPKTPKNRIRSFVKNGGRLVTTDWALGLVEDAFPGKLQKTTSTPDDVVEIECPGAIGRRMIGMHYAQCHPKWWLEGASYVYSCSDDVLPLITSDELERKYQQPNIAVGFQHGKGEVVHFISHFVLQRTHQRDIADTGTLDDFLKNMGAKKTADMGGANVAELEAAYSTLNTVAHLCSPASLLNPSTKSTLRR